MSHTDPPGCFVAPLITVLMLLMAQNRAGGASAEPLSIDRLHLQAKALSAERHATPQQLDRFADRVSRMARDFPEDAVSLYWKGILIDREREPDRAGQAEKLFEQSLHSKTASSSAVRSEITYRSAVMLGLIRLGQGKGEEAIRLARESLELNPAPPEAYRLLIDGAFQASRPEDALEVLRSKVAADSQISSQVLDLYLGLLLQLGDRDELKEAVNRRLKTNPTCPSANYFAAVLQSQKGETSPKVDVLYLLASLNGAGNSDSTIRAQDYLSRRVLDRLMAESSDTDWAWVSDMVARYEIGERRGLPSDFGELPAVETVARRLPAEDQLTTNLKDHLLATLDLLEGHPEKAKPRWERVVRQWPLFVPALCRLAEVLEAEGTPESTDQALSLWKQALTVEPENPLVRDHVRLGLDVHATRDGVEVDRVVEFSPASEAGLAASDTILAINGKELTSLPLIERLRRVRLFTGGELRWKTKSGDVMSSEVPLLLLE